MSREHLIPLNQRPIEEARAIQRKGGLTKSLQKKYAQQFNAMKKRGDTNETIKWFCTRLQDPEANILHIQRLLDKFIDDNPKEHNLVAAVNTQISLHKAHFGDKKINTNLNINTDLNTYLEAMYDKRNKL